MIRHNDMKQQTKLKHNKEGGLLGSSISHSRPPPFSALLLRLSPNTPKPSRARVREERWLSAGDGQRTAKTAADGGWSRLEVTGSTAMASGRKSKAERG